MTLARETKKFLANKKIAKFNRILYAMFSCVALWMLMSAHANADDYGFKSDRTYIYSGCKYDELTRNYYYEVEGVSEEAVISTALNGTYSDKAVSIKTANGIGYTVFKDGKEFTDYEDGVLIQPGEYAISVFDNSGNQVVPLRFTIIEKITNVKMIDFPSTCKVESVRINGTDIYNGGLIVSFEEEGDYEINYRVIENDKAEAISMTIDYSAPTLNIKGLNAKNEASGPVEISDIEENCTVTVVRNGSEVRYSKILEDSGKYVVTVQDEAKNQTTYEFTILPYYNLSSLVFFCLCAMIIIGVVVYVVYLRKNLRVR